MPKEHITEAIREIEWSLFVNEESTIETGVTKAIDFGTIRKLFSFTIKNDSVISGYDITLTINGTASAVKVKAGESAQIEELEITSISIVNASGSTVSYRYFGIGEV